MYNPYLKEFRQAKRGLNIYMERFRQVQKYSYAIPCEESIKALVDLSPLIEIGAGTGYWSWLLKRAGADIIAFDRRTKRNCKCRFNGKYFNVQRGTELKLRKHAKRTLFLCWPDYESPTAYNCLKYYKGETVAYIGEGRGGCTGDDRFHSELDLRFELTHEISLHQWIGIHDHLMIYKRKN